MSPALAMELLHRAVITCLLVAAPLLITSLLVGVVVSLMQALTQIQEQTLTFIPKLVTVAVVMMLSLPWMLRQMIEYLTHTLDLLPSLVG
jgi:flagellar biosynthesis protein FliQ